MSHEAEIHRCVRFTTSQLTCTPRQSDQQNISYTPERSLRRRPRKIIYVILRRFSLVSPDESSVGFRDRNTHSANVCSRRARQSFVGYWDAPIASFRAVSFQRNTTKVTANTSYLKRAITRRRGDLIHGGFPENYSLVARNASPGFNRDAFQKAVQFHLFCIAVVFFF